MEWRVGGNERGIRCQTKRKERKEVMLGKRKERIMVLYKKEMSRRKSEIREKKRLHQRNI